MPLLQDAPSFVRPLILRSIRKQVPDTLKPRFLPLTSNESAWKQAAHYTPSAPDAAYILLVDHSGTIRWQTHDPLTPTLFQQLTAATRQLATETAETPDAKTAFSKTQLKCPTRRPRRS